MVGRSPACGASAAPRATVRGHVASLLRRTAGALIERPRAALWTLLALTAALVAVGVAFVAADNVDTWSRVPHGRASVVIYLAETVEPARGNALATELSRQAWVDRAEYVAPAETARRLEAALGPAAQAGSATIPKLLDGVDVASLPASIEVVLAPGVRDVVAMSPSLRSLRDTPGIDDVVVEDGGEDRVAGTLATVRGVAWTAAAVVAGLALIVVLAVARVRLDGERRDATVAQLLGAGPGYIAIPSALAGMLTGALAAALAAAAIYAAASAYGASITGALASVLGDISLALPDAGDVALFVAAGAALGLVGGSLAGVARAPR